jgi:CubicO group peptidase (beta-lactamase class C family)
MRPETFGSFSMKSLMELRFSPLALVFALSACSASEPTGVQVAQVSDSGQAYVPAANWRTADPAAVGMDAAKINSMKAKVSNGTYGSMHGVLIVRYGWLVTEHYAGWSAATPHTLQSVSKSVTSLLYGMATAPVSSDPFLLNRSVLSVFSRYPSVEANDARKQALTMRDLLTMRANMDYYEQPYAGSPHQALNNSTGDWTKFILDRPMTGTPGSAWSYNSGAAILVGSAIKELTGEHADVFARRELFAPIGVTGETWFRSPFDGLPHSGGGLNLKPQDLARVGYLVLRRGKWGDRQVVPETWIDSSTKPVTRGSPVYFSNYNAGYGRFWWIFPKTRGGSDEGVIAGSGSGGQWLFIVPSLDLVVAIVAENGNGLDLFYNEILPAVRS